MIVVDEFAALAQGGAGVRRRASSTSPSAAAASACTSCSPRSARAASVSDEHPRQHEPAHRAARWPTRPRAADVIGVADAARIPRGRPGPRARAASATAELTRVPGRLRRRHRDGVASAAAGRASRDFGFGAAGRRASADRGRPRRRRSRPTCSGSSRRRRGAAERERLPPQPPPWLPPLRAGRRRSRRLAEPTRRPGAVAVLGARRRARAPAPARRSRSTSSATAACSSSAPAAAARRRCCARSRRRSPQQAAPDELHALRPRLRQPRARRRSRRCPHCGVVIAGEDEERVDAAARACCGKTIARAQERFARARRVHARRVQRAGADAEALPRIVVLLDGYAGFAAAFERIDLGELVDALPRLVGRRAAARRALRDHRRPPRARSRARSRRRPDEGRAAHGRRRRVRRARRRRRGRPRGAAAARARLRRAAASRSRSRSSATTRRARASSRRRRARRGAARALRRRRTRPPIAPLPTRVAARRRCRARRRRSRPSSASATTSSQPSPSTSRTRHFLVAGPYRSGRSTALETIAALAARRGPRLAAAPARAAPHPARRRSTCWTSVAAASRRATPRPPSSPRWPPTRPRATGRSWSWSTTATSWPRRSAPARSRRSCGAAATRRVRIVAAVETQAALRAYGGWLRELRKDEHGLLLDPDLDVDGELLGVRLPRRTNAVFPPGRGYFVWRGALELVQVAV